MIAASFSSETRLIAPLKPPDSTPLLSVSGFIYNLSSHP